MADKTRRPRPLLRHLVGQVLRRHRQQQRRTLAEVAGEACVSVQYLQQPGAVLSEVARVLRPGAPVVISFSNRCFPTKAVRGWLLTPEGRHGELVA